MSRTSGRSSTAQAIWAYWKRFAEWAIGLARKYQEDPFFQSESTIIALQVGFAGVMLAFVAASFSIVNRELEEAVKAVAADADVTTATLAPAIIAHIQSIRTQNFLGISALIILATIVLGYIVARVALAPTRNALAAQKQFIGNIAHELRTPLSILKTNAEIALLEEGGRGNARAVLTSMLEELDRMSDIINNLLSFSRLVRPERLEFAAVDLGEVVADTVTKFSPLARMGNHEVTLRRSPDTLVWGNETALRQIASNLLKNAITYTPSGGTITLTIARALEKNMIELLIQDTGAGIERRDLFRIFEPFYRADQSRNRGYGGSGLGLAIVSELVKLHHGKITIRSAVGRGTSVIVLIPAARIAADAHEDAKGRADGLHEIAVDFSA